MTRRTARHPRGRGRPPDYPAQQFSPAPVPGHYPPLTNTMAILALALVFSCWSLTLAFGHIAPKQIRRTGKSGQGLATAGLVIGYLVFGITPARLTAEDLQHDHDEKPKLFLHSISRPQDMRLNTYIGSAGPLNWLTKTKPRSMPK